MQKNTMGTIVWRGGAEEIMKGRGERRNLKRPITGPSGEKVQSQKKKKFEGFTLVGGGVQSDQPHKREGKDDICSYA